MRSFPLRFILFAVLLSSCSKEKTGTCETSFLNYQGYRIYDCAENKEEYLCEGTSPDYEQAFYPDKPSCESLGYGYQESDGDWVYSSTSNGTPGPNGRWGSGSGGSGGSSGTCSGAYKSPTTDAQLNAWCGAAYAYRCQQGKSLSDPAVKAVCQYYNDWKEPGVPDCGYCK